jgi:hypothetical protein
MRRRQEGPRSQPEQQDMERVTGTNGPGSDQPGPRAGTGPTGSGMQGTGTGYQPGARAETGPGRGATPAPPAEYRRAGYDGMPAHSRHGAALSILAGSLAFLEGLAFVIRSHFYHGLPGYAYRWSLHGWGWVLLILGALLFAGGVSHLLGVKGSRHFAAIVAVITAVVAFITLFYSIVWGIVVLAACGFAAHSLLSDRGMRERDTAGPGSGYYGDGGDEAMARRGERSHRVLVSHPPLSGKTWSVGGRGRG